MASASRQWKGKTGGGTWGQKVLFSVLSRIRVTYLYPVLYLVIPFYMLFGRKACRAVRLYFKNHFGDGNIRSLWRTYKSHILFGQVVLDKFAVLAGKTDQFSITVENMAEFNRALDRPEGFIVVSAHIGNFELAGVCMRQDKKQLNGLVYGGETSAIKKQRRVAFSKSHLQLIQVSDDFSHLFAIKNALDRGEIVTVPCDRLLGSQKSFSCEFLGKKAIFPTGTFRFATKMQAEVYCVFIMKESAYSYRGYVTKLHPLTDEKSPIKKAEYLGRQYVAELEKVVKQYPEQWFNYFDFWNELQ